MPAPGARLRPVDRWACVSRWPGGDCSKRVVRAAVGVLGNVGGGHGLARRMSSGDRRRITGVFGGRVGVQ